MGNHGEPAVVAEVLLEDLHGIEIRLRGGVSLQLAEEVAVQVVKLMAADSALSEVAPVGFCDFVEGGVIEMVFPFQPGHAKGKSRLTRSEIDGLTGQPKSSEGEQKEGTGECDEARNGGTQNQRAAMECLWWPSRGLMALK